MPFRGSGAFTAPPHRSRASDRAWGIVRPPIFDSFDPASRPAFRRHRSRVFVGPCAFAQPSRQAFGQERPPTAPRERRVNVASFENAQSPSETISHRSACAPLGNQHLRLTEENPCGRGVADCMPRPPGNSNIAGGLRIHHPVLPRVRRLLGVARLQRPQCDLARAPKSFRTLPCTQRVTGRGRFEIRNSSDDDCCNNIENESTLMRTVSSRARRRP